MRLHEEFKLYEDMWEDTSTLRESVDYPNRQPLIGTDLDMLVQRYNENFGGHAIGAIKLPKITRIAFDYDDTNCDIILELDSKIIRQARTVILRKLFRDFPSDKYTFDELLEFSWTADDSQSIAFWYGRAENLGIKTGLSDIDY